MNDQILTGTKPAADARLIADVMQAPAVEETKPSLLETHGGRMLSIGIHAGIVGVLKDLNNERDEAMRIGDTDRRNALNVAILHVLGNMNLIYDNTAANYTKA